MDLYIPMVEIQASSTSGQHLTQFTQNRPATVQPTIPIVTRTTIKTRMISPDTPSH